jgi:DNA polymerase lambda
VEQLEAIVSETALSLDENAEVVTCGSYRRGKSDCGDIDIIITNKKGKRTDKLFSSTMDQLHEINFLTDVTAFTKSY